MQFTQSESTAGVPYSTLSPGDVFVRADISNPREVYMKSDNSYAARPTCVGLRYGQLKDISLDTLVIKVEASVHAITPLGVRIMM